MPESITGSMLDWVNRFLQRHDLKRYVPFTGNLQVRRPSFQAAGEQYLKMFIELGGLEPDERVLDIGCGPGRMAVPLATYLSPAGSYVGMDVVSGTAILPGPQPMSSTRSSGSRPPSSMNILRYCSPAA
jgi:SAM-dependent methyltransferase